MVALDPRELDELDRFLSERGAGSLFEYLELSEDADGDSTEEAIARRRRWAQGQQANPKFRSEALWVIKNARLMRKVLGEARAAYKQALSQRTAQAAAESLGPFIQGILAAGSLTPQGEDAIRAKARELGLDTAQTDEQIRAWLQRTGVQREATGGARPAAFHDWYALLDVPPDAPVDTIEQAYRRKYRWARQLRDTRQANQIYAHLDEAWRILKSPGNRARYDKSRKKAIAHGDSVAAPELELSLGGAPPQATGGLRLRAPEGAEDAGGKAPTPNRPTVPSDRPTNPGLTEAMERSEPSGRQRTAPRPPEDLAKVAMEVSGRARPRRPDQAGPRLVVEGPTERVVKVGRTPAQVQLVVRNTGEGQLQGTVHADRDWVEVDPGTLDPGRRQQTVTVTIHPSRMPRRQAVCYIGISANRGQRASVTLQVRRPDSRPVWALAVGLLLSIVGLAFLLVGPLGEEEVAPSRLIVDVDPPGAEIFVAGQLESSDGDLDLSEGLPSAESVEIRAELDGFETWSETVAIPPGQTVELSPELVLADTMAMTVVDEAQRGEIDMEGVKAVLSERRSRLEACLARHAEVAEPGTTLGLRFRVRVKSTGTAVGYEAEEREGVKPSVDDCVKRELRAIRYPLVPGQYGEFSYGLRGTLPAATEKPSG